MRTADLPDTTAEEVFVEAKNEVLLKNLDI